MFQTFYDSYDKGNIVGAEKSLIVLLDHKESLNDEQLSALYNNFGAIYTLLGRYNEALEYYSKAESIVLNNKDYLTTLARLYINKALIFHYQRSYPSAIEYFEKGIRIYSSLSEQEKSKFSSLSSAYLNNGMTHLNTGNFKTALSYFEMSASIKDENNLPGSELVYLNLAKTYMKLNDPANAELFFLKSITGFRKTFGENYYRLPEVYFDYGLFLAGSGRNSEALEIHKQALSICIKNYGERHILVSQAFKILGDDYMLNYDYSTALTLYQKSLIAIVPGFNNPEIFTNPPIDSSLLDIRLLDNLKSKSQALDKLAVQENDPATKIRIMEESLETVELALNLIEIIRNNYMSEDSRIYLSENEKETYILATHIAGSLFSLTKNDSLIYIIYGIAQKAKAAILRNEITGNDLLYSTAIPDSLREKQTRLTANIAAYNKLVQEEDRNTAPDSIRIALWKDALFEMNREKERVAAQISSTFPGYSELIRKIVPVTADAIQKQLKKDETIVDYLISNVYIDGSRKLYTFVISRDDLIFRESNVDSSFIINAIILRNISDHSSGKNESFNDYTLALNYMYTNLIAPVENLFSGNKIIIIPDEEISWLPFDAFIRKIPETSQSDFEGLTYLIYDYIFSYGYSSSLIFKPDKKSVKSSEVIAFSPSYDGNGTTDQSPSALGGALNEIESVYKWFGGRMYAGDKAIKTTFLESIREPAIFHLAMHSMSDTIDSRYSYILFAVDKEVKESGRLYNYEISLARLNSPMVVLSACDSGTGTLYSGEGQMSLARGFLLAGASSVIKTAWEVNDEASSDIIVDFYKYLSKGKQKNEALRLAKLKFLETVPPSQKNPYYWAAYEVLGDNAPVVQNNIRTVILLTIIFVLVSGGMLIYFRRRRIFSERL
jgi:CHAT domain-containing protein/Tfp pilus assembly protein PilF